MLAGGGRDGAQPVGGQTQVRLNMYLLERLSFDSGSM